MESKPLEELSEDDLYQEVVSAHWNIGNTSRSTYGVTLTFRYHHTSDFPGMVTRTFHGRDRSEAMIKFLKDLEENPQEPIYGDLDR
jgi:hypothetical protein